MVKTDFITRKSVDAHDFIITGAHDAQNHERTDRTKIGTL